ncbi:MAG TPA: alkaline phosphatase family protein, partial [Actinomycetota bacterium]|nr:alkaline phosphatase family protein [Actinomycetota bacterium]
MQTYSRRTLLKGMAAGAGLALAGPLARFGSGVASGAGTRTGALAAPGSLPFPHLPPGTDTLPAIDHIVVLMMENHSFDNYFGMLGRGDGFRLGPDGMPTSSNPDAAGNRVRAYHAPDLCQNHGGVSQSWNASHRAWDNGANDGFVIASSPQAIAYYRAEDLPFYYGLAGTFPVCDRYFSSVLAQTYPNRRFLMAGTALGQVGDPAPSLTDAPPNGTIFDRLDDHGISWKNYFVDLPTTALFPYQLTKSPGKVLPVAAFLLDASLGTLPAVSLVDPQSSVASEESPQDIAFGAAYASAIVHAVLTGPAWPRTVLIFTYDEGGGYYDHVPPPAAVPPDAIPPAIHVPPDLPGGYDHYGFRVPTVIVSPWARPNYVSHEVHDHTSILKLIETKWNLPALTYRDANANDLRECLVSRGPAPFEEPPQLTPAPPS